MSLRVHKKAMIRATALSAPFASLGTLLIAIVAGGQTPTTTVAQNTTYTIPDLGTLGGDNSVPLWITNTGDVVGYSETGKFDGFGNPVQHAFVWSKGLMQDLGTLGGNNSFASGGNDEGQIVGYADLPGGATSHAAFWYRGTITNLGTLAGPDGFSFANLINKQEIVGASTTNDGSFRGFVWDRGVMTELGTLGGSNSFALGINDRGQIVGIAQLNDVVNPSWGSHRITEPSGIMTGS